VLKLKALHLGWVTDSLKTILALHHAGIEPVVVNTDPVRFFDKVPALPVHIPVALNLYENSRVPYPHLFRQFLVSRLFNRWLPLFQLLARTIKENGGVDFVFAHWGVGVLPEVAMIKSRSETARLPLILNMGTFPTAPSGALTERLELRIFRWIAPLVDGLIIPSQEMADLIYKLSPAMMEKPALVKPMYYPKEYLPAGILPKLGEHDKRARVVFVGQFDLSHRINDVRKELLSLAQIGVYVHCAAVDGLNNQNIVQFQPFNAHALVSGTLTRFMTQFGACLVSYNVTTASSRLRFRTSIPSRFLIALIAGIPIILPKGRFMAMENFVYREKVGYAFQTPEHAYLILISPSWDAVRERCAEKRKKFTFEPKEFKLFVQHILQRLD